MPSSCAPVPADHDLLAPGKLELGTPQSLSCLQTGPAQLCLTESLRKEERPGVPERLAAHNVQAAADVASARQLSVVAALRCSRQAWQCTVWTQDELRHAQWLRGCHGSGWTAGSGQWPRARTRPGACRRLRACLCSSTTVRHCARPLRMSACPVPQLCIRAQQVLSQQSAEQSAGESAHVQESSLLMRSCRRLSPVLKQAPTDCAPCA